MSSDPIDRHKAGLRLDMSEFWSGDLGLTLVTISVTILIFVITPLRDAGLRGRLFFDVVVEVLMIYGAIVANPGSGFSGCL